MTKYYKVSCEYYIKAKDHEEAENEIVDELVNGNFMESHIIIDEVNKEVAEKEGIYNEMS